MASLTAISRWDLETDLVICGFGAAGASAAIEAHDLDPSAGVLILEKAPEGRGGGNARVSGQSLLISHDAAALTAYQRAMSSANPVPEEMLCEWARRMVALEPWIKARAEEAGATFLRGTGFTDREAVLEFPDLGAAAAVAYTATILPIPSGVWLALEANVARRKVPVRYGTAVTGLVQDPESGEVFGVLARTEAGGTLAIKARRGVILATGGFEANLQMQRDYYGLADAWPLGAPTNTGDGIHILQKAGADLWHMRNQGQSGGVWPGIAVPGLRTPFLRNFLLPAFSWIDVDANGKRFYAETNELQLTHYKEKRHGRWLDTPLALAGPVHMIFDEATLQAGKLVLEVMGWAAVVEGHPWSDDNRQELAAGLILKADTLQDLGKMIGVPPAVLAAEIEIYNAACGLGDDKDHGRRPESLMPVIGPPYFAVPIVPAIVCTGGGGRRTIDGHVLTPAGTAIPRLFEAGELGSMFSDLYQNGSYLTEAMISGRAAAASALAGKAWG